VMTSSSCSFTPPDYINLDRADNILNATCRRRLLIGQLSHVTGILASDWLGGPPPARGRKILILN